MTVELLFSDTPHTFVENAIHEAQCAGLEVVIVIEEGDSEQRNPGLQLSGTYEKVTQLLRDWRIYVDNISFQ